MADQVMLETRIPVAVDHRLEEIAAEDGRSKAVLTADMLRFCLIDHPGRALEVAEEMREGLCGPFEVERAAMLVGALDPELGLRLQEVAATEGVDAGALAVELLADLMGIDLEEIEAVEAGMRDVREGRVYEHEEVKAYIRKVLETGT